MSIESVNNNGTAYQGSTPVQSVSKGAATVPVAENSAGNPQGEAQAAVVQPVQNINVNGQEEKVATNEQIKKAVENINKNYGNTEAVFGIHDGTNRVTIKIVDRQTKKVVKEFPPEKTLDMIAKVWEMAGLMVDEKR